MRAQRSALHVHSEIGRQVFSYGTWLAGQAWQVSSGAAHVPAGQTRQEPPTATSRYWQETHAVLAAFGTAWSGQATQVFPSAPPTTSFVPHSWQLAAPTFVEAQFAQVCAPTEIWCGPHATQAAVASPGDPTRIVRAGQPVNVQAEVASVTAGLSPMNP